MKCAFQNDKPGTRHASSVELVNNIVTRGKNDISKFWYELASSGNVAGGTKTRNGITITGLIDEQNDGSLKGIITCDCKNCEKNETEFKICLAESALKVPKSLEKQMLKHVNSVEG